MKRKIYGISSKYMFGTWSHRFYMFETKVDAQEWLQSETYDFAEREVVTKTELLKRHGKSALHRVMLWHDGYTII